MSFGTQEASLYIGVPLLFLLVRVLIFHAVALTRVIEGHRNVRSHAISEQGVIRTVCGPTEVVHSD